MLPLGCQKIVPSPQTSDAGVHPETFGIFLLLPRTLSGLNQLEPAQRKAQALPTSPDDGASQLFKQAFFWLFVIIPNSPNFRPHRNQKGCQKNSRVCPCGST